MTANYVARQLNYHMPDGWGQGDTASQAHFKPPDTFGERFEAILRDIKELGFDHMDLWGGILSPIWATPEHISIAKKLLDDYGLTVLSFANGIPDLAYMEAACKLCAALNIPLIGGGGRAIQEDRNGVIRILQQYGVQYGYENHPEPSAEIILFLIGDDHPDLIGVALDTGWIGTQGADIIETTRKLLPRIKYVHVKDVREAGQHRTCKFGDGVVDLEGCIGFLVANGYTGGYSVEHEPEMYDPTQEIIESTALLRGWLGTDNG